MSTLKPSAQIDEQTLVWQAGNGDLEAFNQLVMAYHYMAYKQAQALLSDPDSAEDAVPESLLKALQTLDGFRGGSFRGWMFRIVTNSAYNMMRQFRRHPTQPLFPDGEEIETPSWLPDPKALVQETVERAEEIKRLYQRLDELTDVYRSVLILIELCGLDYLDAAEVLKVNIGTIKSGLARALLRMKQKLGNGLNHPDGLQFARVNCG
jgi:RNA polymerase sigma-70 factor, ECF subfamily